MRLLVVLLLGAGVVLVAMGPRDCHEVPVRVGGMKVAEFCGSEEAGEYDQ